MRLSSPASALALLVGVACSTSSTQAFQAPVTTTGRVAQQQQLQQHRYGDVRVASHGIIASQPSSASSSSSAAAALSATRSALRMSSSVSGDNVNEVRHDDTSTILQSSIIVGTITAAIGFLYGKALSTSVDLLWKKFPVFLTNALGLEALNPVIFITAMCTFGGALLGTLKSFPTFGSSFTVADFVSAFSSVPARAAKLPASRSNVLPLLTLSLLTSTFGFSIGPEAPMVCTGGLIGATMARRLYGKETVTEKQIETLAYAGAAGSLTAFMGIPIAGSIFALEMTRSSAGLSSGARDAFSPAIAASLAGLVLLRGVLIPSATVGGHFSYGALGAVTGGAMLSAAVLSGLSGALIGTTFHKVVKFMKSFLWPANKPKWTWKRQVAVKIMIGLAVGLLSSQFPQTLFWGEGSLQCAIDGQQTAFAATHHGLSAALTSAAQVNPSLPFASAGAAFKVGMAKLVAIILASAGKFPGGIIFPLFFAGAPFAHAMGMAMNSSVIPIMVMGVMASAQAAVTRTPLASALILSLSASPTTPISIMFPACLVSCYTSVWIAQLVSKNSYFQYAD